MKLEEHLAKAQHNWAFLAQIEDVASLREFRDWNVVVLTYSALHLLDALLHANGRDHGETHQQRAIELQRLVERRRMSRSSLDAYLWLTLRSRRLRYDELLSSDRELSALTMEYFRPLEAELVSRLRLQPFPRLPFEPQETTD